MWKGHKKLIPISKYSANFAVISEIMCNFVSQ